MKHILAIIKVLLFASSPLFAQQLQQCGSQGAVSADLIARALQLEAERGGGGEVRTLKLKVVIAATDNGQGGQALATQPSKVQAEIDVANEIFARCNTGIQIQLCGPIQVVEDAGFYWSGDMQSPTVQAAIEKGYITALYAYQLSGNIGGYVIGELIGISSFATPSTLRTRSGTYWA